MLIYHRKKGIILAGKAWEIREYLKQQRKNYDTVEEWSDTVFKKQHTAAAIPKKYKGSLSIVLPIVFNGNGDKD
ncbi:Z-ring formation inhibitor MciZ [Bacillus tamaricis]|uniref:Z-ring formation inhibitor MciZ n=1 Tax=Evansella tamaricis TaxID=2069301 RepID=A0ABS6JMJ8_9BACI|nr:Z-ring formation inhibitor MciZ [Evansella tamaricis]